MTVIKKILQAIVLAGIGGTVYMLLEAMWRGYTHWAMFFVGGLCFLCVGTINEIVPWEMSLYQQMFIGAVVITSIEFASGCILNLLLGLNIWDYSNLPGNILGQICLPFTILWFFLSLVAIVLDDWLRWKLFGEEKPHYVL